MEKTMHECLLLDNTSGWITQISTEDENEIKAHMDWQTDGVRIHYESGFREYPRYINMWKKQGTETTSFTTVTLSLLDDKGHTKSAYVLRNRDYANTPSLQYLSRTGRNNHRIQNGSEEYLSVLENLTNLLDNQNMDSATSSMLVYMLKQMRLGKCDNTSCPEFLSKLVKLGNQQRQRRIEQRQNTPEVYTLIR